jgi:hypothetical protein
MSNTPIKRKIPNNPYRNERAIRTPYLVGRECAQRIDSYAKTKSVQDENAIFKLLVEMGLYIVRKKYRRLEDFVQEESVYKIAGDVLMNIVQDPKKYHSEDGSFYPYFGWVLKSRMIHVLKENYERKQFIYVEQFSEELIDMIFKHFHTDGNVPIEHIAKQERYTRFVSKVLRNLYHCPRFNHQYRYLAWPLIASVVYAENRLFDSLDYRDRTALRVLQCFLAFRVESYQRKMRLAYVPAG